MNDEQLRQLKKFLEQFGWDMGLYDVDDVGQIRSMVIGEAQYIGQMVEEFANEEIIMHEKKDDPNLH